MSSRSASDLHEEGKMPMASKKRRGKNVNAVGARLIRLSPSPRPGRASSAAKPPVYLVVEHHGQDQEEPSHSVLKLEDGAVPVPLASSKRCMSFAAVKSRYGPLIVGVGDSRSTTVYNPTTSKESWGPLLLDAKVRPVLITHGRKLYALSRIPTVLNRHDDFLPWFVVLNSDNVVDMLAWDTLPAPPIFPCRLNPLEYRDPPEIRVASYAVVGSHILLSVQQDKGTCAFDVDTEEWEMVSNTNLPFTGQAVPLGGHLFVACSKANEGAAAAYYIRVIPPPSPGTGKTEVSILELPVASKGIVPGQFLCALGNGSFSSFDVRSRSPGPDAKLRKARIIHRTYSQAEEDGTQTNSVVIAKQQRQIYKLLDRSRYLAYPSPVVAALTMESG